MRTMTRIFACAMLACATTAPPMLAQALPMQVPAPVQKSTLQQSTPDIIDARWRKRCNGNRCKRVWTHNRRHYRPNVVVRPRVVIRPRTVIRPQVVIRPQAVIRDGRRWSRHDRWCMRQYRSYNPASNRYLTYGGVYKRCNSPFR